MTATSTPPLTGKLRQRWGGRIRIESHILLIELSGPMTALKKFFLLPRLEKRLLLLAATIVVGVRLALWVLPSALIVRATRRIANAQVRTRPASDVPLASILRMVEAVSHRVPAASCLTQALSAQMLLHRFGYSSRLCLGVALGVRNEFQAHAWLERDGKILIGRTVRSFTRLPDLTGTLAQSSLHRQHP